VVKLGWIHKDSSNGGSIPASQLLGVFDKSQMSDEGRPSSERERPAPAKREQSLHPGTDFTIRMENGSGSSNLPELRSFR
jgi:hypothetical protein